MPAAVRHLEPSRVACALNEDGRSRTGDRCGTDELGGCPVVRSDSACSTACSAALRSVRPEQSLHNRGSRTPPTLRSWPVVCSCPDGRGSESIRTRPGAETPCGAPSQSRRSFRLWQRPGPRCSSRTLPRSRHHWGLGTRLPPSRQLLFLFAGYLVLGSLIWLGVKERATAPPPIPSLGPTSRHLTSPTRP